MEAPEIFNGFILGAEEHDMTSAGIKLAKLEGVEPSRASCQKKNGIGHGGIHERRM